MIRKILSRFLWLVLVLIFVFLAFLGFQTMSSVTNLVPQDETIANQNLFIEQHDLDIDEFRAEYQYKPLTITNEVDSYDFQADSFNLEPGKDIFVMIHGLGVTAETLYPHSEIFLQRNFSVVLYDQRNSGDHPVSKNNMGIKEKDDLISVVNYLQQHYPEARINIFAESYGAHTFLHAYDAIKDKINLVILDSPLANGEALIYDGIDEAVEQIPIPSGLVRSLGNISTRLFEGYSYEDTNGIKGIDQITNPILIISNENDSVTPFSHAKSIYNKSSEDRTLLLSESKHSEMFFNETDKYIEAIDQFLTSHE